MTVWSQETAFALTEHDENGRQTPLIKDWKEMTTAISDMMALLGSLKESPFFNGFADTIQQYATKLALLDGALAQLNLNPCPNPNPYPNPNPNPKPKPKPNPNPTPNPNPNPNPNP